MEDDPFSKLKESLDQLQQHDKDFVPEYCNSDDLLTFDDDVVVMGGVMTEEEIPQEIRKNETVEEEEELEEDGDNEKEIPVKPTPQKFSRLLKHFLTFRRLQKVEK